jgi:hypothetical protein
MRSCIHQFSLVWAIACLVAIPLDLVLGINAQITSSFYRYVPWIAVAWVFAIVNYLSRPRRVAIHAPHRLTFRLLIHRASLLLLIVSLCMLPLGCVVEANEWGRMADGFESASLMYAFIFAVLYDKTRPLKSA